MSDKINIHLEAVPIDEQGRTNFDEENKAFIEEQKRETEEYWLGVTCPAHPMKKCYEHIL